MALTKISTDTIDLSSDTTALKMPKGTTTQRPDVLTVDYLVVAGGGGGGWLGGGGGAGGYLTDSVSLSTSSAYSVIIGAGGSGGNSGSPGGGSGANSKFTSSIEAIGGGSGGGHSSTAPGIGGSGGGGPSSGNFYNGAAGTPGQGNSGGDNVGNFTPGYGAGGGGGAGSAGVNGTSTTGGNGGDGLQNNLDGNNYYYAGGGGGGVQLTNTAGTGGSSIGGDGGNDGNAGSDASPANRGSGGGGGGYSSAGVYADGGDGSDGIIIISVPVNYTATFTSGVTANGVSGGGAISPNTATGYNVWVITVTTNALQTVTFSGTAPTIGTTRENTTTGKMEIYTGAKGWRALQQTGQDVGIVGTNNFNTVLYVGNRPSNNVITGVGFQPGLTWIKDIDAAESNTLFDNVRGAYALESNTESVQSNFVGYFNFDSDGFTVGDSGQINTSSNNIVSWNWKASDAFSYPTVGSQIASAGNTNVEAGFSIVQYTGVLSSSGSYEVQHGLGGIPEIIISKEINRASTRWVVRTQLIDDSPYAYLVLSGTDALQYFNGGVDGTLNLPTATKFDINWNTSVGTNAQDIIAYCFRSIPGYSLMGTYTGTGVSTATPRIYTGFEPAWIMVKCVDSTRAWNITDNKRNTTNPRDSVLQAQSSDIEYTNNTYSINFYNDGFQIVNADTGWNIEGERYLFMCFAS